MSFWLPNNPNKPKQYRLRAFYIGAYAALLIEGIAALVWAIQIFVFKFTPSLDGSVGTPYRLINTLFLFHFGTPLALTGIVQQAVNRNSVLWWTLFAFLIGFFGDLETLLDIAVGNLPKTVMWAYRYALALAIINFTMSVFSIVWYLVWRKYLPSPVEQTKQDKSLQPLIMNY